MLHPKGLGIHCCLACIACVFLDPQYYCNFGAENASFAYADQHHSAQQWHFPCQCGSQWMMTILILMVYTSICILYTLPILYSNRNTEKYKKNAPQPVQNHYWNVLAWTWSYTRPAYHVSHTKWWCKYVMHQVCMHGLVTWSNNMCTMKNVQIFQFFDNKQYHKTQHCAKHTQVPSVIHNGQVAMQQGCAVIWKSWLETKVWSGIQA